MDGYIHTLLNNDHSQNNSQQHTSLTFTGGEPYGAQLDQKGRIRAADCAHAAVLRVDDSGQLGTRRRGAVLCGPSAIAFGSQDDEDTIYLTDSEPLGETTLEKLRGSIFSICKCPSGGQILRPLAFECLAHPCGIATSPADPKVLFVAEMMQNRILRLYRCLSNTYHLNIFHQFAGGLGPSCVAATRAALSTLATTTSQV